MRTFIIGATLLGSLFCQPTIIQASNADTWINSVSDNGAIIRTADNHIFLVEELDRIDSQLWLPVDDIVYLRDYGRCIGLNAIILLNLDENEQVCAEPIY